MVVRKHTSVATQELACWGRLTGVHFFLVVLVCWVSAAWYPMGVLNRKLGTVDQVRAFSGH